MNEPTYSEEHDYKRLVNLRDRIVSVMECGIWLTLGELQSLCGNSEAGISARLRELRNKFDYTVNRRRRGDVKLGIWEYQLEKNNHA